MSTKYDPPRLAWEAVKARGNPTLQDIDDIAALAPKGSEVHEWYRDMMATRHMLFGDAPNVDADREFLNAWIVVVAMIVAALIGAGIALVLPK